MDPLVLIVEFFGTFLILISYLASGQALVMGATLALIMGLTSGISGGHVNPAISFTMWLKGALTASEFASYLVAQYSGGVAAYYAYSVLA